MAARPEAPDRVRLANTYPGYGFAVAVSLRKLNRKEKIRKVVAALLPSKKKRIPFNYPAAYR